MDDDVRRDLGSIAPSAPAFHRDRVGGAPAPAASLLREAQRRRDLNPHAPRRRQVLVYAVASTLLLVLSAVARNPTPVSAAVAAVAALVSAGLATRCWWTTAHTPNEVSDQIRAEQQLAAHLALLEPAGWTVLHDRVIPGGEHRVAHLLVGPAGVLVVSTPPGDGTLALRGRELWTGDIPLTPWIATKWWEAQEIATALSSTLGRDWRVVVTPWVLAGFIPAGLTSWGNVAIRSRASFNTVVGSLASPWSRTQAAYVAGVVDELCPPA